jgi:hypothetical protein
MDHVQLIQSETLMAKLCDFVPNQLPSYLPGKRLPESIYDSYLSATGLINY